MLAVLETASTAWAGGRTDRVEWPTVRLQVRVARCAVGARRAPVHDRAWVERQVASARAIFATHHLRVELVAMDFFDPDKCELITRADRHALARFVSDPPLVTVLVLQRIQDVDLPTYNLMGVHWRYRGATHSGRRWIYLTARARPPVLAHELGHYLGLPHDRRGGNLMTPGPSDPIYRQDKAARPAPFSPRFTPSQARRLRAAIRAQAAKRSWP